MKTSALLPAALALLLLCDLATAAKPPQHVFETTYKDPDAKPMKVKGTKVVAAVMIQAPDKRRAAEDALAKSLTKAGAIGIPLYKISMENAATQEGESKTRAAVEAAGAQGLVVMRPVDVNHRSTETMTHSGNDIYGGYWGGYSGIGWNDPWIEKSPDVEVDIVVTVETYVFSLPQNKLVWSGTSITTNPKNAVKLVQQLAKDSGAELRSLGLIEK